MALFRLADGQFHGHYGNAHQNQKCDIEKYKNSAAVLTADVRKFPYIADADRTACTDQNKSQTGFETVSFFHSSSLLCKYAFLF